VIAKHVPMRSVGKSDFAGLVRYVTDEQSKEHRLGAVQLTNCEASTLRDAITEVLATQYANTRAASDKTFHLIVSFRAGEQPSAETLRAIEARICDGLGYGEHQRVSAVHHDTDNLHVHIAVNKIHPARLTIHEPYYSHRALAELCATLERDYGLECDNHQPQQTAAASRAADMERHAGIESLAGWIKRECLADLHAASSWTELHQVLRDNALELRARGNGLVFVAQDGTTLKASTIGRDLSRSALEKRLGTFEAAAAEAGPATTRRSYQKAPVRLRIDTTELYARYKATQGALTVERAEALAKARSRRDRATEAAKRANATRRAALKLLGGGALVKRTLYAQAGAALRADLEAVRKSYDQERAALYQAHRRQPWADWLKQQATAGDAQALDALRARASAGLTGGNTIEAAGQVKPGHAPAAAVDSITKKGTIIYRAGPSAVRDDGARLQVSREATREGTQAALRLAMEKYGERITVTGSAEFKAAVILAAVDARLPITFADAGLERRRLALIDEQQPAKPAAATKPLRRPVGQVPPPQRRHGLRTLAQLEGLRIGEGQRPTPTPTRPPAGSELEQRKAKLRAELDAKKAKRQGKGRGL